MYTATITHMVLDFEIEIASAEGSTSEEAQRKAFDAMPAEYMAVPDQVTIHVAKEDYYPIPIKLSTYLAVTECEEIAA